MPNKRSSTILFICLTCRFFGMEKVPKKKSARHVDGAFRILLQDTAYTCMISSSLRAMCLSTFSL